MKRLIFIFTGLIIAATVHAAPEDFIGTFNGTEKITVTNCGAYNGVSTGLWRVEHADLQDNKFTGVGSNNDGDFTTTGEVVGSTSTGVAKGTNKYGLAWKADFNASIDGEKYTSTTIGSVSNGCKFVAEVEAIRK